MTWETFTEYYTLNVLPSLATSSQATYEATLNVFERTCNPQRRADVTKARITAFVTQLRLNEVAEATHGTCAT
jgi:hypothetical protein